MTTSYGLKISKSGKNVLTATGRNLIYDSEQEYLFIQIEDVVRIGDNHNIPHGLTYFPTGAMWADGDQNEFYKATFGDPNASVAVFLDLDNYQVKLTHAGSSVGDEIYYMVFNDPSNI